MIGYSKLEIGFESSTSNDPFSQYEVGPKILAKVISSSGIGFGLVYG